MIIDGVLEGSEVVAVHQTWHAVPCCVWYSFNKKDATILNKVRNWLKEELVDTEMLGDDSDPIGEENYPWNPDPGPLGNGKYVPSFCFEN